MDTEMEDALLTPGGDSVWEEGGGSSKRWGGGADGVSIVGNSSWSVGGRE